MLIKFNYSVDMDKVHVSDTYNNDISQLRDSIIAGQIFSTYILMQK